MILLKSPQATKQGWVGCLLKGVFDWNYPNSNSRRGRVQDGGKVTPALTRESVLFLFSDLTMDKPNGKGWCYSQEQEKWFRIRKLTPRECFRLMGVSEENIDIIQTTKFIGKDPTPQAESNTKAKPISKSQQYKMAGNSIVVDVMALMFENLFKKDLTKTYEVGEQMNLFD